MTEIKKTDDIKTLALMSIHTDKGMWWGNDNFGSEIYTLLGGKLTKETLATFKAMVEECLAWIVADGIASEINVEAKLKDRNTVEYKIIVARPNEKDEIINEVWTWL